MLRLSKRTFLIRYLDDNQLTNRALSVAEVR